MSWISTSAKVYHLSSAENPNEKWTTLDLCRCKIKLPLKQSPSLQPIIKNKNDNNSNKTKQKKQANWLVDADLKVKLLMTFKSLTSFWSRPNHNCYVVRAVWKYVFPTMLVFHTFLRQSGIVFSRISKGSQCHIPCILFEMEKKCIWFLEHISPLAHFNKMFSE